MVKQSAFVFIKPHAVTEAVKTLVSTDLQAKGFTVERQGTITAEEIDQGKLVRPPPTSMYRERPQCTA
jgi:hypothetical protein